jgi:hypothetical protein
MTNKTVFVFRIGFSSSSSLLFSFLDNLTLNNVTLILCTDMDVDMSIETHMKYDQLILRKNLT